ncbi:unnamed protein product [Gadus morhua 'NCC']
MQRAAPRRISSRCYGAPLVITGEEPWSGAVRPALSFSASVSLPGPTAHAAAQPPRRPGMYGKHSLQWNAAVEPVPTDNRGTITESAWLLLCVTPPLCGVSHSVKEPGRSLVHSCSRLHVTSSV